MPTAPRKPLTAAKQTAGSPRRRREGPSTPLTRARIVSTALALVDRDGLGALSMRRLGTELGVDPMAVYYHIPNKEALCDAIVEAVMADIDLAVDRPDDPPEARILVAARAYRDTLLAHRNALPIILERGPATPGALRPVELLIGVLRAAGLPPGLALAGMTTLAATVRGTVGMAGTGSAAAPAPEQIEAAARQLPPGEFPFLREAMLEAGTCQCDFEFGIRALARGLLAEARACG
jgi:AcrR family transcriptional regulator